MQLGADYRRIWLGNASANLADGITFIALPLLATRTTDSPLAVAGLAVAYSLSRIVSVLGTGVLIDRVDRRRLLYLANGSRAGMFAVLTGLVVLDAVPIRRRATPAAMMGRVGSLDGFVGLIGLAVGAGAGGLLASELGYRAPFAVAAALFAGAAVLCLVSIGGLREWEDGQERAGSAQAMRR
ncbi:MFS transporter [Glycomyces sp. TRM65418]|uniref:MFS transporter n=1 Tax=Glycomyces sp. TRM65418 TaxID=2867006 RepID=UPI001CE50B81|nr:MFS transporter [Glycomyces sp. TRM65418]MCC3765063.1 MFS transporter [Glycomyces sp. TRM65418]QZD54692.1 MFS transporter [Glycomyces sp. TRM65418]